jgi:hypothetical protein
LRQMYRMCDLPTATSKAAIPVASPEEAKRWNTPELGFGIFATVNTSTEPRRKENLRRINAWAVDMDEGTKQQMHAKLQALVAGTEHHRRDQARLSGLLVATDGKPSTGTRSCSSDWCRSSARTLTHATCAGFCVCRAFCISRTRATRSRFALSGSTGCATASGSSLTPFRGSRTRPNTSGISAKHSERQSVRRKRRHGRQQFVTRSGAD